MCLQQQMLLKYEPKCLYLNCGFSCLPVPPLSVDV
uniref:Uncharacterized protein n=1 Tax=Anguilla anguilla TaxID=7936 RepID=A0A0E9RIG6_ANGAN